VTADGRDDELDPPSSSSDTTNWESPRWREGDEGQRDTERRRRFRSSAAPSQRGAIDAGGSVDGGHTPKDQPAEE
jgi:hypothetical protein